jgi:hypothetical protein
MLIGYELVRSGLFVSTVPGFDIKTEQVYDKLPEFLDVFQLDSVMSSDFSGKFNLGAFKLIALPAALYEDQIRLYKNPKNQIVIKIFTSLSET